MKIGDYKNEHYSLSGIASSIIEKLIFAGIAIIWLFKIDLEEGMHLPKDLLMPTLLLVICLILHFAQYFIGSELVYNYYKKKVNINGNSDETEINEEYPRIRRAIVKFFYYSKSVVLIISYSLLSKYLILNLIF